MSLPRQLRWIGLAVGLIVVLGLAVWLVGQPPLPVQIPGGAVITRPKAFFTQTQAEGLFLAPDGSLWHWGKGKPLWPDDSPIPQRAGSTNRWADVAAGSDSVVGIRPDGSLWTWGLSGVVPSDGSTNRLQGRPDAPIRLSPDTGWRSVVAGLNCFYALRSDGSLWAWGDNVWGQLGIGRHGPRRFTPVQLGSGTNWMGIRAGGSEVFGLRIDGSFGTGARTARPCGIRCSRRKSARRPIGRTCRWAPTLRRQRDV